MKKLIDIVSSRIFLTAVAVLALGDGGFFRASDEPDQYPQSDPGSVDRE